MFFKLLELPKRNYESGGLCEIPFQIFKLSRNILINMVMVSYVAKPEKSLFDFLRRTEKSGG